MERLLQRHTHTHTKPPSGQGLTLTLKVLCLAPVIATSQPGYVVSISTSRVLWARMCVCERNHNVCSELLQTPSTPRSWRSRGFCLHVHRGFCFCANNWETTAVPPTTLREGENNCAFDAVCLWWWRHRKWDHAEGSGCVCRRAYWRAGPGQEENTNHLLAGLDRFMKVLGTVRSVQCMKTRWWLHQALPSLPPHVFPLPLTHLILTLP